MPGSPGDRARRPLRVRLLRWLASGIALLGLLVVSYYTVEVAGARRRTPALIGAALQADSIVLDPEQLPPEQLSALLAVQDPAFFEHRGWDLAGGTMTTITQALVKVHYFEDFRPGLAKIRQSLIARFALDPLISKDDQLRLFLNEVYLGSVDGEEVRGLARGAQVYFGKPFTGLDTDEFLSLVAMFPSPNALDPIRHPAENARRVRQIHRLLAGECDRGGPFRSGPTCWSEAP